MMENKINFSTKVQLNNGVEIPLLGFGTAQIHNAGELPGEETEGAVLYALRPVTDLLIPLKYMGMRKVLERPSIEVAFQGKKFSLPLNCGIQIMVMSLPSLLAKVVWRGWDFPILTYI